MERGEAEEREETEDEGVEEEGGRPITGSPQVLHRGSEDVSERLCILQESEENLSALTGDGERWGGTTDRCEVITELCSFEDPVITHRVQAYREERERLDRADETTPGTAHAGGAHGDTAQRLREKDGQTIGFTDIVRAQNDRLSGAGVGSRHGEG